MESNYRSQLERLLTRSIYEFFEKIAGAGNLYQSFSRSKVKLILRYHSQAVIGILRQWTEEDTKNLDQIVHEILSVKLCELDEKIGWLHSRVYFSESAKHSQLKGEIEQIIRKMKEEVQFCGSYHMVFRVLVRRQERILYQFD